jgi:serine/threonine protein kinase
MNDSAFEALPDWHTLPPPIAESPYYTFHLVTSGKFYALMKLLRPQFSHHPVHTDRVAREGSLLKKLHHPHIIQLLDTGFHHQSPYLLLAYTPGRTLRQYLQENNNKNDSAVIISQLCNALAYLHAQGVIHRDLKPENIWITAAGNQLKLLDFDLAMSDSLVPADYVTLQAGTPNYIAPEQSQNPNLITAQADIYSLGIVALEILTGKRELDALKYCPAPYKEWIQQCICQQPHQRPANGAAAKALLEKMNTSYTSPPKVRWLPISISIIAGLIIIIYYYIRNYIPANTQTHYSLGIDTTFIRSKMIDTAPTKTSTPDNRKPVPAAAAPLTTGKNDTSSKIVYICQSSSAKVYHIKKNCTSNCKSGVEAMSLKTAMEYQRRPCKRCVE